MVYFPLTTQISSRKAQSSDTNTKTSSTTETMDFNFDIDLDFDFGEFANFEAQSGKESELNSALDTPQAFDAFDAQNQTLSPSVLDPSQHVQGLPNASIASASISSPNNPLMPILENNVGQNAPTSPESMYPANDLPMLALKDDFESNASQTQKKSAKQLLKAKRITARERKRKKSIGVNGSYSFKIPVTSEPVPRPYGKLSGTIKANVAPPPGLPIYGVDILILAPRWTHRRGVMWNLIRNGWTQHDMAAVTNYYRGLDLKDNDVCKHVTKAREVNGYQKDDFATMPLDEIQSILQPNLDWSTIYDLAKGVVKWPPDEEVRFWSPLLCCAQYCQATGNQTRKLSDAALLARSIGFLDLVDGVNHDAEFLKYIREALPKRPRRQRSKT